MNRPYLFMTGEPTFASTLAFSDPNWDYTSVPTRLIQSEYIINKIRRENRPRETLSGIIHYADVSDKQIEKHNLQIIKNFKIPCWPNADALLKMTDRHSVMNECINAGFVNHKVYQCNYKDFHSISKSLQYPYVIKTGTEHRGIGKNLVLRRDDIPLEWDGLATIEPYFEGESVRVLIIGKDIFSFKTTNPDSWIKNSPGADIEKCSVNEDVVKHAQDIARYFDIDIAGVDYIVSENGHAHFLEVNQYPGLGVFDDVEECAKKFVKEKMYHIHMQNA